MHLGEFVYNLDSQMLVPSYGKEKAEHHGYHGQHTKCVTN